MLLHYHRCDYTIPHDSILTHTPPPSACPINASVNQPSAVLLSTGPFGNWKKGNVNQNAKLFIRINASEYIICEKGPRGDELMIMKNLGNIDLYQIVTTGARMHIS